VIDLENNVTVIQFDGLSTQAEREAISESHEAVGNLFFVHEQLNNRIAWSPQCR
jgi:hypothetical protein